MSESRPLLLVQWEDSSQPSSWVWLKSTDTYAVTTVRSVGWVVRETDDVLVLAPSLSRPDEDGDVQALGVIRVPKRAIVVRFHLAGPADHPQEHGA